MDPIFHEEKDKDKEITVNCRGTIISISSKYLSRIDLFRTQIELTNNYNFKLDYSLYTFHSLLDWLRDIPFNCNNIPNELESIFKYLNIDCEIGKDMRMIY